ncbi:MAG TPA: hypothetical protein VJB60_03250, partial [Candidatus Peribacterales bacterium]|nr:hypothetical protein [Candidatus Peribacterales bacterium]
GGGGSRRLNVQVTVDNEVQNQTGNFVEADTPESAVPVSGTRANFRLTLRNRNATYDVQDILVRNVIDTPPGVTATVINVDGAVYTTNSPGTFHVDSVPSGGRTEVLYTVEFNRALDGLANSNAILDDFSVDFGVRNRQVTYVKSGIGVSDPAYVGRSTGPQPERKGIVLDKSANVSEVAPGGNIIYTITISNASTEALMNLTVTDRFDPALITITNANQGNLQGGAITWTIPELKSGERWVVRYSGQAKATLAHGTVIANTAVVDGTQIASINERLRSDSVRVNVVKELPQTGAEWDDWKELQNGPSITPMNTESSAVGTFFATSLLTAALFLRRKFFLLGSGMATTSELLRSLSSF